MHDHETCEQLMAAASRVGHTGRLEYLAARCDLAHGDLPQPTPSEEKTDG